MPQLYLEHSPNILEEIDPKKLFFPCHRILVETCNALLQSCQSRIIAHRDYFIGDGNPENAFVLLEIFLLEGRTLEALQAAKEETLDHLERYFSLSRRERQLQITVVISQVPLALHKKNFPFL
jgi:5-carboxymethyl-2-hydroxymuconate isomerase